MRVLGVCVSIPVRRAPLIRPTLRLLREDMYQLRGRAEGDERPVAG
jgi:hypothetical protein